MTTAEDGSEPFTIGWDNVGGHEVGNPNCKVGWCGGWGFPKPCSCGGLIHAEFEEESEDDLILSYKCDSCLSTDNSGD